MFLSCEILCLGKLHSVDPRSWGSWPHWCQDHFEQAHTVLSGAEYFWTASVYWYFHLFFGTDAFCEAAWARLLSPVLVAWLFQALDTHIPMEGSGKEESSEKVGHQLWKHIQYLYWHLTLSPAGVACTKKAWNMERFCFVFWVLSFYSGPYNSVTVWNICYWSTWHFYKNL